MKSSQHERDNPQIELFKVELWRIVDASHEMVKLADIIDWENFEGTFVQMWQPQGRPSIDTRVMVSLHYLKYTYDLSDEEVVESWLQNPYWQYLSGMRYFQHTRVLDPSSMSRWRKRAGKAGLEQLLTETIRAGLKLKAVKTSQLKRVNIDTTVQEKHIRYPTDSRLYDRARQRLVKQAECEGIRLRQNYKRVGHNVLIQQQRYAHARQFNRADKCQKTLRTLLGRVIRDIERKAQELMEGSPLASLLETAKGIHTQQRSDKNKIYSVHALEVQCISKGKVHKRYEFGVKASIATTSKGGWHVGAMSLPGHPYDGHTLSQCFKQIKTISPRIPEHLFTDQGYRGHGLSLEQTQIHVDKKRRGRTPQRLWSWMKRRAAIEPGIVHLKAQHRLNRNRLWGHQADMHNVILSAAAINFHKLLKHIRLLWLYIFRPLFSILHHHKVLFSGSTNYYIITLKKPLYFFVYCVCIQLLCLDTK